MAIYPTDYKRGECVCNMDTREYGLVLENHDTWVKVLILVPSNELGGLFVATEDKTGWSHIEIFRYAPMPNYLGQALVNGDDLSQVTRGCVLCD